jgi:1-acyl-sn-glycerol-3-phosphate acyltransferase
MSRSVDRDRRAEVIRPSRGLLALFDGYLRWRIPRSFRGLRLAHAERANPVRERLNEKTWRLIVCLNHPSWWDPLVAIVLSRVLLPGMDHYAPMEASALRQYGFMRRLGLFPVDNTSARAGVQFVRSAAAILGRPDSVLWLTPEGRFTDVRRRPLEWKPGVAALAKQVKRCALLPLALEYTFWDEGRPEALALLGEPLWIEDGAERGAQDWQGEMKERMRMAQDELAALAMRRDPAGFVTVIEGRTGAGGVYGAWKDAQGWFARGRERSSDRQRP